MFDRLLFVESRVNVRALAFATSSLRDYAIWAVVPMGMS